MNYNQIKQIFKDYKLLALVLAIVCIWLFFYYNTEQAYLTPRNLSNLFRQMAVTGLLACGMVFVIISGEIDLSVGSQLGLVGGIAAILDVTHGMPIYITLITVIFSGLLIGAINGFLVAFCKIPSFIVSLAAMLVFRGALIGITDGGKTISDISPQIVYLGQGYLSQQMGIGLAILFFLILVFGILKKQIDAHKYQLPSKPIWQDGLIITVLAFVIYLFVKTMNNYQGIPVPVLILLTAAAIFTYTANQTVFGRRIYAVGSNMEATRLSGVNVNWIKLTIFSLMGLMCAFAALINTARLAAATPNAGTSGELDAIAACFIGGTSMRGGSGTVYGALIGALVMASLDNGMSLMDVDAFWQMIVKGLILLVAVWIDVLSRASR